jgi:hypothetical protein
LVRSPASKPLHLVAGWFESGPAGKTGKNFMLYTIAIILLFLWLLGLVTGTTIGGFIHVLLILAVVMILFRLFSFGKAL